MSAENCDKNCPALRTRRLTGATELGKEARFEAYCNAFNDERITILHGNSPKKIRPGHPANAPDLSPVEAAACLNLEYKNQSIQG